MVEKFYLIIRKNLKYNILITMLFLLILQLIVLYLSFNTFFENFYFKKVGEKAVSIALTVSKNNFVLDSLKKRRFIIQGYIEQLRKELGCEYIVVADRNGIRFSHPNPNNIGKKFVGDDYEQVVSSGKVYYSQAVGTLGPSIRGFAPVYYDGEIIGFVAVGYLKKNIALELKEYKNILIVYLFFIGLLGIIFTFYISKKIKKLTLDKEPLEIANLYLENEAILNSIKEGIVSLDNNFKLKYYNKPAEKLFNKMGVNPETFVGTFAKEIVFVNKNFGDMDRREFEFKGLKFLVSSYAMSMDNEKFGFLMTFMEIEDIDELKMEIDRVKRCTDAVRAQSHEYANKLHLLSGLLQLEAYDEAKRFLIQESEKFHHTIDFIENKIKDSYVRGIIAGKLSLADELGVKIIFDSEAKGWNTEIKNISLISTIIANSIQNAIEAAINTEASTVLIRLDEDSQYLYFTVEDSGRGIDDKAKIFKKGFSTKGENRGYGLYNLDIALKKLGGRLEILDSKKLKGAKFEIVIPKENA
jgi:sensor histidine kinase regulating citrate/malate metabolism